MFNTRRLVNAIKEGDVDFLRKFLQKHPEYLDMNLKWDDYHAGILHLAAYLKQPGVVEFLVTEKGMDIHRRTVGGGRTPLHVACQVGDPETVSVLLRLGADPLRRNNGGITPYDDCQKECVTALLRPAHEEDLQRKILAAEEERKRQLEVERRQEAEKIKDAAARAEGTWTRTASCEVMHQRELPGGECRLTNIFNFSTRCWVAIAKDLKSGQLTQNIQFFDAMPDKEMLYQACAKLSELGEHVDSACIERRALRGKTALGPAS